MLELVLGRLLHLTQWQGLKLRGLRRVSQLGITGAVLVDSKGGAGPRPWARTQTEWLMQRDLKLQNFLQTVS